MPYAQGINFRNTVGFVTDISPADCEASAFASISVTYPRTTAQGNNVGYEAVGASGGSRDRIDTGQDTRLAGVHFYAATVDYRFDLPAIGNYNLRCALGDHDFSRTIYPVEIFDTSSSLGTIVDAGSTLANQFVDATNTVRTAAAWPTDNQPALKTFTTTICRFRCSVTGGSSGTAHYYVEAAAPVGVDTPIRPGTMVSIVP